MNCGRKLKVKCPGSWAKGCLDHRFGGTPVKVEIRSRTAAQHISSPDAEVIRQPIVKAGQQGRDENVGRTASKELWSGRHRVIRRTTPIEPGTGRDPTWVDDR